MPFKLKLKKSRHYSVVSKSLFVISVEILDGTNVECTLSSESTGQDCLDIVCQKLGLNQLKFFGLQYVSCHSESNLCWLELDKPMKRQLDKHARALSVYLRVMYYVISGVRLITDEVTRWVCWFFVKFCTSCVYLNGYLNYLKLTVSLDLNWNKCFTMTIYSIFQVFKVSWV